MAKQWIFNQVDETRRDWISRRLGISPLLATILLGRGIEDPEQAEKFLEPQTSHLNDPFLLPDIEVAVGRIWKAITDHEKILVFGHDDTDGATSTVIMMETLRRLGAYPEEYIPDRSTEGYGFKQEVLERFSGDGVKLVVTVDSESSDFPGVRMARDMGIDVIITDHHEIQEGLPKALAVINPKRGDCHYPFRNLAGVGVAFQVARALIGDSDFPYERYLDLVAMGTIADRVPLVDDNRVVSRLGYGLIGTSNRVGIAALRNVLKPEESPQEMITLLKYGLSHGGQNVSARLLQTEDPQEANRIATELRDRSQRKRQETQAACQRVLDLVEERKLHQSPVVIVVDQETPLRALGACASAVRRSYGQPAVLIGFQGEHVVGEGRAPVGFDIFAAFQYCEDLFMQYGGHRGAGGFSMDPKNINEFRQRINQYARELSGWRYSPPYLRIDGFLDPAMVDGHLVAQLERLVPFGQANPVPQFCCQRTLIEVFPEAAEDQPVGTMNSVPFFLGDSRGLHSPLLAILASAREADVIYGVERSVEGTPRIIVGDAKAR